LLVLGCDPGSGARLARDLASASVRVDLCDDLSGGYSAARELRPAVIVVGPEVPGEAALDLARSIREDREVRPTFLILVSDRGGPVDVVAALDAGANDFLEFPVDREELLARVRAGLRCREMHLEMVREQHREALLKMAATLGHEVNNPLTALFGHLELALRYLEQGSTERMQHHLEVAGEVATRIGRVVQALTEMDEPRDTIYLGSQKMLDLEQDETLHAPVTE
jgi:DNA-binding response OmpR family regulator